MTNGTKALFIKNGHCLSQIHFIAATTPYVAIKMSASITYSTASSVEKSSHQSAAAVAVFWSTIKQLKQAKY